MRPQQSFSGYVIKDKGCIIAMEFYSTYALSSKPSDSVSGCRVTTEKVGEKVPMYRMWLDLPMMKH